MGQEEEVAVRESTGKYQPLSQQSGFKGEADQSQHGVGHFWDWQLIHI